MMAIFVSLAVGIQFYPIQDPINCVISACNCDLLNGLNGQLKLIGQAKDQGRCPMHDAAATMDRDVNEKVCRDKRAYRNTGESVYEPKGSDRMNMECSKCEEDLPFCLAAGAHKECGHLLLFSGARVCIDKTLVI